MPRLTNEARMLTVTRHRAFLWGGFAWTLRVECVGDRTNDAGELAGVDYTEFWQWLTDHVTAVAGHKGPELLVAQQAGALQDWGEQLMGGPDAWTPERMSVALLREFRLLSDMVHGVTVVRTRLSSHGDDTTECTARPEEYELVTRHQLSEQLHKHLLESPHSHANPSGR